MTGPCQAAVRQYPFPYRAMLAVCSDLDLTPGAGVYLESMRFLNTTAETRFGRGVDLEVGNSIYFDMPAGHLSYWNADDAVRSRLRTLIKSGHIDCLHSFGDLFIQFPAEFNAVIWILLQFHIGLDPVGDVSSTEYRLIEESSKLTRMHLCTDLH